MPHVPTAAFTRRDFLAQCGMGMGSLALGSILNEQAQAAGSPLNPLTPKQPHFPARAKRVIHLFMNGGPSQVDTFDPKPQLAKYDGKKIPLDLRTERPTGAALKSPYSFQKYGESGLEISELFPNVARSADELCVIRSMHADVPNHEPSLLLMNCGDARLVRPSVGSWVTYGLGSENQNLPGFIAMCPGGYPIQESQNWQAGFLPGVYQGMYIDSKHTKPNRLIEHIKNTSLEQGRATPPARPPPATQSTPPTTARGGCSPRITTPVVRARLPHADGRHRRFRYRQGTAAHPRPLRRRRPRSADAHRAPLSRTRGSLCPAVARRRPTLGLHDDLEINHRRLAGECDQAIGALLTDLKQRGMLEDTLVIWGGEFGRTPAVEMPKPGSNQGKINGRDHNHYGFTMWMAGGGVKRGHIHGATDEFGFKAVENPVHVHDLHATILHLLGFDHESLTYRYAGRDFRLTDVHGKVVHDIIA